MPKPKKLSRTFTEIRRLVKASGRSYYDIAKSSGISETTISRIGRGLHEPGFETAETVLRDLGYEIAIVPAKGASK